jgi:hypothetical protein
MAMDNSRRSFLELCPVSGVAFTADIAPFLRHQPVHQSINSLGKEKEQ